MNVKALSIPVLAGAESEVAEGGRESGSAPGGLPFVIRACGSVLDGDNPSTLWQSLTSFRRWNAARRGTARNDMGHYRQQFLGAIQTDLALRRGRAGLNGRAVPMSDGGCPYANEFTATA